MKVALFGAGQMGFTIAYMLKLLGNYHITCFDRRTHPPLLECDEYVRLELNQANSGGSTFGFGGDEWGWVDSLVGQGFDIVLSALPCMHNEHIATLAIGEDIPYFDLGGSVEVADKINKLGREHGATVFTDLGLAPGWANIMAEEAYSTFKKAEVEPLEINMRCGGLPAACNPKDPFNYKLTWSIDGLYNEYVADSELLEHGKIKTVPSLGGICLTQIQANWQGNNVKLEEFYTSGGASHTLELMQKRGVENCNYKTLRYPGHAQLIDYFINEKQYNKKQLSELFCDHKGADIVVVHCNARSVHDSLVYNKTYIIRAKEGFSAMQLSTASAFVSAVRASPLTKGQPLNYSDIKLDMFNRDMDRLGFSEEN